MVLRINCCTFLDWIFQTWRPESPLIYPIKSSSDNVQGAAEQKAQHEPTTDLTVLSWCQCSRVPTVMQRSDVLLKNKCGLLSSCSPDRGENKIRAEFKFRALSFSLSKNVVHLRNSDAGLIIKSRLRRLGYYNLINIITYFIQLHNSSEQIIWNTSSGCASPLRSLSNGTVSH